MDNKNKIADELDALSPEEVKAIGEIEIGPSKQDQFLNKHYKKLIVGGIALMVAISAGICVATFKQQHKAEGASVLVDAAAVTAPGEASSPAAYDAKTLELVQAEFGDTVSAGTARLMEGLSLLSSDSTAERGVSLLMEVADSADNDLLAARALASIAFHYMGHISEADADSSKKAEEAWNKVLQLPLNAYSAVALVSLSDMAQAKGDTETARAYLDRLAKECPNSSLNNNRVVTLRRMLVDTDMPVEIEPMPEPATPAQQPATTAPSSPSIFDQPLTTPGFGTSPLVPASPLAPSSSTPAPAPAPAIPAVEEPAPAPEAPAAAEEPAPAPEAPAAAAEEPAAEA